jgi:hypothetical protein
MKNVSVKTLDLKSFLLLSDGPAHLTFVRVLFCFVEVLGIEPSTLQIRAKSSATALVLLCFVFQKGSH